MQRRNPRYCTLLALAGLAATNLAQAQGTDEVNARTMRAMSATLKSGAGKTLGTQLSMLQRTMDTMQRRGLSMTNESLARAMPCIDCGQGP